MSQIMKALQESETSNQSGMTQPLRTASVAPDKASASRPFGYVLLALFLPVCFMVYLFFTAQDEWERLRTERMVQQHKLEQESLEFEPLVKNLLYPEFVELEPLSELKSRLNQSEKRVEIVADTKALSNGPNLTQPIQIEPVNSQVNSNDLQLDSLDLSELSPELAQRVQQALKVEDNQYASGNLEERNRLKLTENETQFVGVLPEMNLQTHMYSSTKEQRWVKINGKALYEGDWLGNEIKLVSISPRVIVIEFNNELIEIPALYEWKG